jgi:predicted MPP superfamily phosphohydrolase
MRSLSPAFFLVVVFFFISWLNYRFLSSWYPSYKKRSIRNTYLLVNVAMVAFIGYSWANRLAITSVSADFIRYLSVGAIIWLIGQVLLLVLLPVIYFGHRLTTEKTGDTFRQPTMTRRQFLHKAAAFTPLVAFGVSAVGTYEAQSVLAVQRYSFQFSNLPEKLNGFKIAQISDTHLGPYFTLRHMARVVESVGRENPDLLVYTGDFADNLSLLRPAINLLSELSSAIPYGMFFCWGNHEYFRNINLVRRELQNSPLTILENSSALIVRGDKPVYLLGVDYPWANTARDRAEVCRQYFTTATRGVPNQAFRILLAHHPDFFDEGFKAGVELSLAGHTHGGQVVVAGQSLLPVRYKYMRGLYQSEKSYGYVNSGAGHWFPFRLGCPPEIGVFTLTT